MEAGNGKSAGWYALALQPLAVVWFQPGRSPKPPRHLLPTLLPQRPKCWADRWMSAPCARQSGRFAGFWKPTPAAGPLGRPMPARVLLVLGLHRRVHPASHRAHQQAAIALAAPAHPVRQRPPAMRQRRPGSLAAPQAPVVRTKCKTAPRRRGRSPTRPGRIKRAPPRHRQTNSRCWRQKVCRRHRLQQLDLPALRLALL